MQNKHNDRDCQKKVEKPLYAEKLDSEGLDTINDNEVTASMSASEQDAFSQILSVLLKATHVDFSHYRKTTIMRRLSRRMSLCKKNNFTEYLEYIKECNEEIQLLYNDFLLSYTEFFRESSVFDTLKAKTFPALIKKHSSKDTIRIWIPGCSTGEEVYSLAICFQEFLQESNLKVNIKVQFFGTDLNSHHIAHARAALYPDKIRKNLSPTRIEQFFDQTPLGLKVTKNTREMCVFAVQNVTLDPPFSNIDMVSCRNVLIYFDTSFLETVIPLFHFSLRNDGFLLLGSSETMGRFPELFTLVDQKSNLYTKRHSHSLSTYTFPINHLLKSKNSFGLPSVSDWKSEAPDLNDQINSIILEKFAPPCVLVDSNLTIRQFRGRIFPFLEPVTGEASLKLSKMASEGLIPELYIAIEDARKKNEKVSKKDITFKHADTISTVDISVVPVQDHYRNEQCFLILFEKSDPFYAGHRDPDRQADPQSDELERLRCELQSIKEHLQSIIEEKDELNQELWASNEEVQSTNEELRSVNEEMEAAKEELESSNEELIALNEEMRAKNSELKTAKEFLENIIETAKAIVVTLDTCGRIITINRHTEILTGYNRDEVIGKSWFDIFIPAKLHNTIKPIHEKVINKDVNAKLHENPIETKNGSTLIISWSNSILKDSSGQIYATLSIGMDVTEQREAEMALIESEDKYRNLVETSQDCIWQCDREGRFTYLNQAWETVFGYILDEMLGKKIVDFQSPEVASQDMRKFSYILESRVSKRFETICLDKSGSEKHLIFNAVTVYDTMGITGARGTAHDVTDWKIAEQKYRLLFNEMLDGFAHHEIICNEQGKPVNYRFLSINPALENQTGLKATDMIGKTVLDIFPNFEQSRIDIYGKVALTGEPASFGFYSDDLKKYFNVTAFRPAPLQFACIFTDITEQKNFERALQDSINRFNQLTLQTRTFIWEVNVDGLYTFVSPAIELVLGYTPEEVTNKLHFYDLHPEEDRDRFKKSTFAVFEHKGQFIDFHNSAVTKDGKQVFLSTYGTPIINNNGILLGYRGGNTDITERKNTEEIRLKLEQQQQQTQHLESLGILAGGIAHDFNNLLGGIFGFIDLSINECKGTKASQYLTTALATIDRARSFTQQLLTFAKGGTPMQSVGPLFPFIKETVQFALSGSTISCRYDVQRDLWLCNFDKNQIGQVIDNIVINAQQAMPSGGTIELTARNIQLAEREHPALNKGEYVKISIKDYGIGIPKEMLSRIFDPFFTTKAKGHGLGLATCYSIVNRHNGYIEVQSDLGKWTTFHVYLPASNDQAEQKQAKAPLKHEGQGIFVVMDDEEVIRLTFETMLTSFKYTVICKNNGKDVIAWFAEAKKEQKPVRGMIFDLTIPGKMGGKETINEIRKIDKEVPVFVTSGYADDPVMANPEKYGFTSSICKPFRISDLMALLNDHLKN